LVACLEVADKAVSKEKNGQQTADQELQAD
jgi:hypothetical protein